MQDLHQTPQYAEYMQALGWEVAVTPLHKGVTSYKESCYIFLKRIPLVGVIAKIQRPSNLSVKQIIDFKKEHKVAIVYIEPIIHNSKFIIHGFKPARSVFLPSKTIQIDLTKSESRLLTEMKPKTRYNIKIAEKRGVIVKQSRDINAFTDLWKKSARLRWALPQSKEIHSLWNAFGKKAYLLLAYSNYPHVRPSTVTPIAGVLVACSPDTAFYMYAGSTSEGKKLFAPTLVAWEAIKLAKKLKLKTFDFEGIYDERYSSTKSWRGFTKFKEGFGGKVVEFPKTLVFHKNPLLKLFNF